MSHRQEFIASIKPTWIENIVYATIAAAAGFSVFFIFNPIRPMEFIDGYAGSYVYAGENLVVHWDQKWKRECGGVSTRYLKTMDGEIRTLVGVEVGERTPGFHERDAVVMIPSVAARGPATIWSKIDFKCWFGQTYTVTSPKVEFTIL